MTHLIKEISPQDNFPLQDDLIKIISSYVPSINWSLHVQEIESRSKRKTSSIPNITNKEFREILQEFFICRDKESLLTFSKQYEEHNFDSDLGWNLDINDYNSSNSNKENILFIGDILRSIHCAPSYHPFLSVLFKKYKYISDYWLLILYDDEEDLACKRLLPVVCLGDFKMAEWILTRNDHYVTSYKGGEKEYLQAMTIACKEDNIFLLKLFIRKWELFTKTSREKLLEDDTRRILGIEIVNKILKILANITRI